MAEQCRNCEGSLGEESKKIDFSVLIPVDGDYDQSITVPASYMLCGACAIDFSKAKSFDKYRLMQSMIAKGSG